LLAVDFPGLAGDRRPPARTPVPRLSGLPLSALFADPDEHGTLREELAARGFVEDHETRLRTADGRHLAVLFSRSPRN